METFTKLFGSLLVFVYHCFDRIVINGYLSGLSRPEQVVHFFRAVLGIPVVSKEVLSQRTNDYRNWVEAFARNHKIPIEWAGKGVRKEDYVLPAMRRLVKKNTYGVYFIFKSMEQGRTFRISMPKYPTQDPNYRILAHQTSRFTHYYFYIRDQVLGPIVIRVASFFPFHATYWLNGHSFMEQELNRKQIGFRKNDNAFLAADDVAELQAAADRLSPEIIRKQLDYWTLILGPKFSKKERGQMSLSRFYSISQIEYRSIRQLRRIMPERWYPPVLPELHFQTPLSDPQDLRAELRNRSVAADGEPHQRDLRRPSGQETARETCDRDRPDRARSSCFQGVLETCVPQAVREVLPLPAQRTLFQQPARLRPEERPRSSRCGPQKVPDHHRPFRRLPGAMPQRPCGLSPAAEACATHHNRFGPLSRHQSP